MKIGWFSVDGFCSHCNTVFEAKVYFYQSCPFQQYRPSLIEDHIRRGNQRELDELRRWYVRGKGFSVIEMWECEWWRLYKTSNFVKKRMRESFPYGRSLAAQQLLEEAENGKLLGYVKGDIEKPENLRVKFPNLPSIFKNTLVSKNDIGESVKTYADEKKTVSISENNDFNFTIQNATQITPPLLFNLQLCLVCTKVHGSVEYTPKKSFNSFVQSPVDARRQDDWNPNSSLVAETMKLLAISSFGYQIRDRSWYTETKHLTGKRHAAENSKLLKKLDHVNNAVYEVELNKAQVEHKKPIIFGFLILQYAKLRLLESYYNFFNNYSDVNKFQELEMDKMQD